MVNELTARSTSRATVDYDTYVLRYAARQRANILLAVLGAVTAVAAAVYLSGAWLILAIAAGLGLSLAGGAAAIICSDAHATYTRYLAVSVSETYSRPPASAPVTVRPFVASTNGHTTSTGRLDFAPAVWRDLFDRALANGGAITRDDAQRAGVGRRWYHGEGWGEFQAELKRLGFIDARNRLTPAALAWYEQQIALPLASFAPRSRNERTNGERTGANVAVGEAD